MTPCPPLGVSSSSVTTQLRPLGAPIGPDRLGDHTAIIMNVSAAAGRQPKLLVSGRWALAMDPDSVLSRWVLETWLSRLCTL